MKYEIKFKKTKFNSDEISSYFGMMETDHPSVHPEVAAHLEDLLTILVCEWEEASQAVIAFDTETASFNGSVIQLACVSLDHEGRLLPTLSYSTLLQLPEWERMDRRAYQVHLISEREVRERGVPAREALSVAARLFEESLQRGARVVAHNSAFDCARLEHTAGLNGMEPPVKRRDVLCTMKHALRPRKRPRNAELYDHLHPSASSSSSSSSSIRLHDATNDAWLTAKNFLAGRRLGWWV